MNRFKRNVEETGGAAEMEPMEPMSDETFDKELQSLMKEEKGGKKRRKKRPSEKKWSRKRKIITIGASAIGAFFIAIKVLAGAAAQLCR